MSSNDIYTDPLSARYADKEMLYLFSPLKKFRTWRELWIALASEEKKLGLDISDEQIKELKSKKDDINFEDAKAFEKEFRHDVMAHIHAYGKQCPKAKSIIHLGATSAYVGDNTDLIQIKEALKLTIDKLVNVIDALAKFAQDHKGLPTLGFTHLQPAQPTTVGKRACLWIQDLLTDLERLEYELSNLKFLGVKGTTGTQDSFLKLFGGDSSKVKRLDMSVAKAMGFEKIYDISAQTYPRKHDAIIIGTLGNIAASCNKFANDVRILQHLKEIEEPFGNKQVGSSAMAYKKNPMKCERMTSLARFVINMQNTAYQNACGQFLERTLDDSANRRMIIPEAFLATDGILNLMLDVASGMKVYPKVIEKNLMNELPFLSTEQILMEGVSKGGDRQKLHEKIREHAMASRKRVYEEGKENDLMERISNDKDFAAVKLDLKSFLKPERFMGRSIEQVEEFISGSVSPVRKKYKGKLGKKTEIKF